MSSAQLQDLTLVLKTMGFKAGTGEVTALRQAIAGANTAANTSATTMGKGNKVLTDYGEKTRRGAKATKTMTKSVKEQGQGFLGLNDSLDKVIKKVALWTVATGAIFGTIRAVRALGATITEHDTQMTGLRKVYSGAQSDLAMIEREVLAVSRRMQSLTKDTTEAAVTVARTGRVRLEVIQLTEAAVVAQNIAELEAAKAILFLNSALIQFNQTTDQTVRILDEWNELSNRTPATTIDLAMAVSVAGSVFQQAGASLQFLNANTAALVEITAKSGNIIGRAERTMAIYSQRQSTVNKLARIGITVFEGQEQSFIGIDELLTRVAVKWEFLNDRQRAYIAQAIAGTRQQQFFIALMENQDLVTRNLIIQWGSLGSAMKENELFLESISKRTDGLINALERLAINIGDAGAKGAIKGMIEFLTLMVNALNDANFAMSATAAMAGVLAARFAILQASMGVWGAISLAIGTFIATLTALNSVIDTNAGLMREQEDATNRRIKTLGNEKARLESIVETLSNLQAAREQLNKEEQKSAKLEERIEKVLTALQKFYPEIASEIDILSFAYKTFNERLAEQNKLLLDQKRIGFESQLAIINKSIQAQKDLRSTPVVRGVMFGREPMTITDRAATAKRDAAALTEENRLLEEKKEILGKIQDLEVQAAGGGPLGARGIGAAGVGGISKLDMLRDEARIIQLIKRGEEEEVIIREKMAQLFRRELILRDDAEKSQKNINAIMQLEIELQTLSTDTMAERLKLAVNRELKEQKLFEAERKRSALAADRELKAVIREQEQIANLMLRNELLLAGRDARSQIEASESRIIFLQSEMGREGIDEIARLKIKNNLIREEDRLRALILAKARQTSSIISRGIGDAIASGFESDGVNRAMNSMVTSFGDLLAAEVAKSMAISMAAEGVKPLEIGLVTGGTAGIITGIVGFLANTIFGDRTEEERQTDALVTNTVQLQILNENISDLTSFFVNAPAGFAVPAGGGFSGGGAAAIAAGSGSAPAQNISRSLTINRGAISIVQQPGESGADLGAQIENDLINRWESGAQSQSSF